jgi:plasmid maintenance system antidote protein VapI
MIGFAHPGMVSYLETGSKRITAETAVRLAKALNVESRVFFAGLGSEP